MRLLFRVSEMQEVCRRNAERGRLVAHTFTIALRPNVRVEGRERTMRTFRSM